MFSLLILVLCIAGTCLGRPSSRYFLNKNPHIIGGTPAPKGKYPWQLALEVESFGGSFRHNCGASLLSRTKVLTAAHCVASVSRIQHRLVLGATDRDDSDNEQIINVLSAVSHPEYCGTCSGIPNDVAVITLNGTANFNQFVQPAQLANRGQSFVGKNCTVTGWGRDGAGRLPRKLQEAPIDVYSTAECKRRLGARLGAGVTDGHVCIGSADQTRLMCHGDSGGPLNCMDGNPRFFVGGAASWVIGSIFESCIRRYPAAYTSVATYRDFIDQNM